MNFETDKHGLPTVKATIEAVVFTYCVYKAAQGLYWLGKDGFVAVKSKIKH